MPANSSANTIIDLNSRSDSINAVTQRMDQALVKWRASSEPRREYLGCSYLGYECDRKVQYTYLHGLDADAQLLRIFDRGRWAEDYLADLIRRAGIALVTTQPGGGQFEVSFLDGRVCGHADGIIAGSLDSDPLPFEVPTLWECKCLGDKGWKELVKAKLRRAKPHYFGQVQLYMAGLELNQCLFTALNGNTLELHHELVDFQPAVAEELLTRAARILMYTDAGELSARGFERTDYRCRYCEHRTQCWR